MSEQSDKDAAYQHYLDLAVLYERTIARYAVMYNELDMMQDRTQKVLDHSELMDTHGRRSYLAFGGFLGVACSLMIYMTTSGHLGALVAYFGVVVLIALGVTLRAYKFFKGIRDEDS